MEVGDEVEAGDLIGYMGDSGYGKEGTTGQSRFIFTLESIWRNQKRRLHQSLLILKYAEGSQLFVTNPA
ncbi:MAG: hypothetical protein ACLUUO_08075 [Sellimonas intestinalis]